MGIKVHNIFRLLGSGILSGIIILNNNNNNSLFI